MCRLNAMLSDENLLNHARQVQMQALANQIKDSMQFAKDMLLGWIRQLTERLSWSGVRGSRRLTRRRSRRLILISEGMGSTGDCWYVSVFVR